MSKQEVIREAWGDYYSDFEIDENGWTVNEVPYGSFNSNEVDQRQFKNGALIRPKSLQGIENNNFWIKIESEADLPKEVGDYFVLTKAKEIETIYVDGDISITSHSSRSWLRHFTHYQPITKPLKPIY